VSTSPAAIEIVLHFSQIALRRQVENIHRRHDAGDHPVHLKRRRLMTGVLPITTFCTNWRMIEFL
jgi:hypothetical protein